MTTLELKNNFHNLIDSIENEQLLLRFYELIKNRISTKDGELWSRLSKEEKEELLLAFNESEDTDNLIDFDDVKENHKKWQ